MTTLQAYLCVGTIIAHLKIVSSVPGVSRVQDRGRLPGALLPACQQDCRTVCELVCHEGSLQSLHGTVHVTLECVPPSYCITMLFGVNR